MEKINLPEGIINDETVLSFDEFCLVCHAEKHDVIEMVDMGILEPVGGVSQQWQFSLIHLLRFRKAQRLQTDLHLNLAGVALGLELLDEINQLRDDLQKLQHQIKLMTHF